MIRNVSVSNLDPPYIYKPAYYKSNNDFTAEKNSSRDLINELSAMGVCNRGVAYGVFKDDLSFENFNKQRIKARIYTPDDLRKNVRKENILGTGLDSTVYKFDSPMLDDWALKVDKRPFEKKSNSFLQKTHDPFRGKNMGQEIASSCGRYRILKKIKGTTHAIEDWSSHINNHGIVTKKEAESFCAQLARISQFPQSSFDNYANKLKLIDSKDFKQDSVNPNNIMIDYNNQEIYIIDFSKKANSAQNNSKYDLICALLDFSLFDKHYEKLNPKQREDLINSSRKIIQKCDISSKKAGLEQNEKIYVDYLKNMDDLFGLKPEDELGNHQTRYKKLKELVFENQ